MKEKKKKVSNRGAPPKKEAEKVLPNGLRQDQWKRLQDEAAIRSGISAAMLQRQAIDWFFTVLDTKRRDVDTSKLFDEKEVKS